jgi:hypothetical protein
VTDYTGEPERAAEIERAMRQLMEQGERGAAAISEFTVGTPFEARSPLSDNEREVAVALNTLVELFARMAEEAAEANDTRWEGLFDAKTITFNELARRALPQVAPSMLTEEPEEDAR